MPFWKNLDAATAEYKAGSAYVPRTTFLGVGEKTVLKGDLGDGKKAIKEGYLGSTWVYRCVRRKQDMVAKLRWMVRTYAADGTFTDDFEHAAGMKINHMGLALPSWHNMHRATGFLSVTGNSIFGLFGPGISSDGASFDPVEFRESPRSEMRTESPVGVDPIEDDSGGVLEYKLNPPRGPAGRIKSWSPETILHVMLPSLSDTGLWGQSELEALALAVDTDAAGHQWNLDSYGAGGMPAWMMVDYSLAEGSVKKARADLEDRFRSRGRSRIPWLVGGQRDQSGKPDIELHKLGADAQEMDWLNGLGLARDEIVGGLGFHPASFSKEHTTRDNARQANRQAWEQGAFPLIEAFSAWFSMKLLTPEERLSGMVIVPDIRGVRELQEDAAIVATAFSNLVGPNKLSPADGAKVTGLTLDTDEHPEYEEPLRTLNAKPLADPGGGPPPIPDEEGTAGG